MGLTIPCIIKCDGHLPGGFLDCKETVTFAANVNVRTGRRYEFKIRLDDHLPDGWLAKKESGYDRDDKIEFFCPCHGKELEPWRY